MCHHKLSIMALFIYEPFLVEICPSFWGLVATVTPSDEPPSDAEDPDDNGEIDEPDDLEEPFVIAGYAFGFLIGVFGVATVTIALKTNQQKRK